MESIKIDRMRKINLKLNTKRRRDWKIEREKWRSERPAMRCNWKEIYVKSTCTWNAWIAIEQNSPIAFKDTSCTCTWNHTWLLSLCGMWKSKERREQKHLICSKNNNSDFMAYWIYSMRLNPFDVMLQFAFYSTT